MKGNLKISSELSLPSEVASQAEPMKRCTACGVEKALSSFSMEFKRALGKKCRRSHCRSCDVERSRRYRKTAAGIASRKREHRRQFLRYYALIRLIKARAGCCVCGESDSACIDFHHLEKPAKRFAISLAIRASLNRIRTELLKCVCMCANCHRKLHAGRFPLPATAQPISDVEFSDAWSLVPSREVLEAQDAAARTEAA